MMEPRAFSDLIGTVYDAVLRPDLWHDVLGRLCVSLDAKAASVHVVDPIEGRASLFVEHGTDPEWTALLLSQYAGMSPIGSAVLIADLDQPIGAFDFIDEEEFVESRFYREWCAPQGYHDMLGALITKKPHQVGAVSATRLKSKGRFGLAERDLVGLVAPHVRRAVMLSGLLEQQARDRSAIASVIDRLSSAVVIVDRRGVILSANATAERALAAGVVAARREGSVVLQDAAAQPKLRLALAVETSEPQFIPVHGQDGDAYLAVLLPLDAKAQTFGLFLNPQEPDLPAVAKPLAALYGFTPREVAVLMPLIEGKTIEAVADMLGISLATARTHLNRLFAKTGTNRQIDLLQKVLSQLPPVNL